MTRLASCAALVGTLALASCDKRAMQQIAGPVPAGAVVKFFNFGVGSPGVNFYADATKVTAISSATQKESTNGVNYGGVASGGYYSAVPAGAHTLSGRLAADTSHPAVSSLAATLETGKAYSFYQSGIYDATAKTVDAFIVEDNFAPAIDYTAASVRFVNAIASSNPLTLYATIRNAIDTTKTDTLVVNTGVAYKSAGAFTPLAAGTYNLFARYTDSTTNKVSRTGVSFAAGRVYTIGARGNIAVASGATAPALDNTANR